MGLARIPWSLPIFPFLLPEVRLALHPSLLPEVKCFLSVTIAFRAFTWNRKLLFNKIPFLFSSIKRTFFEKNFERLDNKHSWATSKKLWALTKQKKLLLKYENALAFRSFWNWTYPLLNYFKRCDFQVSFFSERVVRFSICDKMGFKNIDPIQAIFWCVCEYLSKILKLLIWKIKYLSIPSLLLKHLRKLISFQ